MACREGVRLAVEWVHRRAIWETDCASVASAINNCNLSRSIISFVLQDIKSLESQLPDFKVQAIKREQNCVAHKLAQLAKHTTHTAVRCAHVRKLASGSEQQPSSHIYEEVWVIVWHVLYPILLNSKYLTISLVTYRASGPTLPSQATNMISRSSALILRVYSGIQPGPCTHEPASYQIQVHWSPTNQDLGPNST